MRRTAGGKVAPLFAASAQASLPPKSCTGVYKSLVPYPREILKALAANGAGFHAYKWCLNA